MRKGNAHKDKEIKRYAEYMCEVEGESKEYYLFLQYIALKQWKELKAYANSKNIKIIGESNLEQLAKDEKGGRLDMEMTGTCVFCGIKDPDYSYPVKLPVTYGNSGGTSVLDGTVNPDKSNGQLPVLPVIPLNPKP